MLDRLEVRRLFVFAYLAMPSPCAEIEPDLLQPMLAAANCSLLTLGGAIPPIRPCWVNQWLVIGRS